MWLGRTTGGASQRYDCTWKNKVRIHFWCRRCVYLPEMRRKKVLSSSYCPDPLRFPACFYCSPLSTIVIYFSRFQASGHVPRWAHLRQHLWKPLIIKGFFRCEWNSQPAAGCLKGVSAREAAAVPLGSAACFKTSICRCEVFHSNALHLPDPIASFTPCITSRDFLFSSYDNTWKNWE